MTAPVPIADLHCDTASLLLEENHRLAANPGMVSLAALRAGGVGCQFFAHFLRLSNYENPDAAYGRLLAMRARFGDELAANGEHIEIARTAAEIGALRAAGKLAAVITVEEGGVLSGRLERLDELRALGVRLITLTWNFENCIGFPNSRDAGTMAAGLKPFGFEAVERMEDLGILVDVSHLSDGGFWDVAKRARKPFIASHSNARALCDWPRNLTDDMLKALANAGGVTGLNFVPDFLGGDGHGSVEQMIAHLRHIRNVAGSDVLALGSDFDGFSAPCALKTAAEYQALPDAMAGAGFTTGEIENICWKNAMRILA